MKKIYVVTPFQAELYRPETINEYVKQIGSIARGYLKDEDIEVHTNYFLEPTGEKDTDGTNITALRNRDNMLQYCVEALQEMAKCDAIFKSEWYPNTGKGYVITPMEEYMGGNDYFSGIIPVISLPIMLDPDYIPKDSVAVAPELVKSFL